MRAEAAPGQLYFDEISDLPRRPIASATARSERMALTPSAMASPVCSTQNPASCDATSGHGHVRVTTTGLPAAIASATLMPKLSEFEQTTSVDAASSSCRFPASSTRPVHVTDDPNGVNRGAT